MTEKQQQLTFEKGITNVPSDITCSDNALAESIGMIYDDGEHRVIQKPEEFITSGTIPTILYIHKFGDFTHYIGYDSSNVMCWGTVSSKTFTRQGTFTVGSSNLLYTSSTKVSSIGKTVIISSTNGIKCFLWKNGTNGTSYQEMKDLPDPKFQFWLEANTDEDYVVNKGKCEGYVDRTSGNYPDFVYKVVHERQSNWNDLIVGLYAKNKKQIAQKRGFCLPFFVRTALELYDGTYTRISNPILLFPCVTSNSTVVEGKAWDTSMVTQFSKLKFTQTSDYSDWKDVVKDVVIFVSQGIEVYDLFVDQKADNRITENGSTFNKWTYYDSVIKQNDVNIYRKKEIGNAVGLDYNEMGKHWKDDYANHDLSNVYAFVNKPKNEIDNAIKGTSVFYKICSVGLKGVTNKDVADYVDTHTLENLTTQDFLKEDDYFSRSPMVADYTYVYNSRLNLAGVKRGFFNGFKFFTPYHLGLGEQTSLSVYIETDSGNKVVSTSQETGGGAQFYFFYPDSRARVVRIGNTSPNIYDYALTEHPALNGAYFFAGIDKIINGDITPSETLTWPNPENSDPEVLPNYIIQSEVNNPFVFKAAGYFKVGIGKIIGVSSTTQALSEGQFGQYPLLAFSSDGIWALSVASTGYYSSVHPISREVCNNAISITQTDGAVFFTSNKGLMVVVGSQVKCVSEQLSGHTLSFPIGGTEQIVDLGNFLTYMASCYIAYDYRDSLLWIFNQSYNYCYVYSIKSGTFSKYSFDKGIKNVVNNYPDYLLQNSDKTVYSLTERPDINADYASGTNFNRYAATMLTRPMKLENALALKTIMKVNHIEHFTTSDVVSGGTTTPLKASLTFRLFASNNLENWVELTSLTGVPWKYYRFRYDFANLKATDRFAGSVIITQERRTNKLR